jgi:hypothetical protein
VAAAVLKISYLDPMIPEQELYLFRPGHIDLKVREKGPGTRASSFFFMMTHQSSPFSTMV